MNLVLDDTIRIPAGIADDLPAFRRWTKSGNYPRRGHYAYLSGDLWVDLSMETLLHNQLKNLFAIVLGSMVLSERLRRYFPDRMRLVNLEANVSVEPDGMFASSDSIQSKRVWWEQGAESLELMGTPDIVLEIVSTHSVQKDTVVLRESYAAAGIAEYWLVSPLESLPKPDHRAVSFDILRLSAKEYIPTRKVGGWMKSAVLGRSFKLLEEKEHDELPEFRLLVR